MVDHLIPVPQPSAAIARRRCGAPLCLALVLLLPATPSRAATRVGLFVGHNEGMPHEPRLRWAETDAERIRELFVSLGGIAAADGRLLMHPEPAAVWTALTELEVRLRQARAKNERTELVLFFSSHGDASTLHLGRSPLPLATLAARLDQLSADTVITIVDACRGAPPRAKGALIGPPFDVRLTRQAGPSGRVRITSTGPEEIAQESDTLAGSFFTHHLLSGLRGAADADADGQVSLAEAYRHAYHETLRGSHAGLAAVQHPEMEVALEGEGELILTSLRHASARLLLGPDLDGSLLVVDDQTGQVLVEVTRPDAGRTVALPAGRFRVQLRQDERVLATEVGLEWGGERRLELAMLTEQIRLASIAKGAFDPVRWSISALATTGSPTALGEGLALGGALLLDRDLAAHPFFWRVGLQLDAAAADNSALRYRHSELLFALGAGSRTRAGPVHIEAALGLGGVLLVEQRSRRAPARLADADLDEKLDSSWTVGPTVELTLGLSLPWHDAWWILLQAAPRVSLLRVGGELSPTFGVSGRVGCGYHF